MYNTVCNEIVKGKVRMEDEQVLDNLILELRRGVIVLAVFLPIFKLSNLGH